MYFTFQFPELSKQLSDNILKDIKKGEKALQKAEKSGVSSDILQTSAFMSLIELESRNYEAASTRINNLIENLSSSLSKEDLVLAHLINGTIHAFFYKNDAALSSFSSALSFSKDSENKSLNILLKGSLGTLNINLKNFKEAETLLNSSLELAQELGNEIAIARANYNLAVLNYELENLDKSQELVDLVLPKFVSNKEVLDQARTLKLQARIKQKQQLYDQAVDFLEKAIKLAQTKEFGSFKLELAFCNMYITEISLEDAKNMRAEQYITTAKSLFGNLGFRIGLAQALLLHAKILVVLKRSIEAEPMIPNAISILDEAQVEYDIGDIFEEMGYTMFLSDPDKSEEYFVKAKEAYKKNEDKMIYPKYLYRKGTFFLEQKEYDKSQIELLEAGELFKQLDDSINYAFSLKLQSKCFIGKTDYKTAEKLLQDTLAAFEKIKDKNKAAYTLKDLADVKTEMNKDEGSIEYLKQAKTIFEEINNEAEQLLVNCRIARTLKKIGKSEEAQDLIETIIDLAGKTDTSKVTKDLAEIYQEYGDILLEKDDRNKARLNFERSRELFEKLDDKQETANSNIRLAMTFYKDEELDTAKNYLKTAFFNSKIFDVDSKYLALFQGMIDYLKGVEQEPEVVANLCFNSGLLLERDKKISEAIQKYTQGAIMFLALRKSEQTIENCRKILLLLKPDEDIKLEAQANMLIGSSMIKLSPPQIAEALVAIETAKEGYEKINDQEMVARCFHLLGNANMIKGTSEVGAANYFKAIEIFEQVDMIESALESYDALVDFHFVSGKFSEASGYLDSQINHALKLPLGLEREQRIRKSYAKQVALNISMNNYNNAIGLINHILQNRIFTDPETLQRLYIELFCLYHLDGYDSETWTMIKNDPEPTYSAHEFYSSLGPLYGMFYNRIGRLSIYFHYLGDIYFDRRKWRKAISAYGRSQSLIAKEISWIFEESKNEIKGILRILTTKANNAKVKSDTSYSFTSSSKGTSRMPCLRCIGNGTINVTLPTGKTSSKCPLCKGTGFYIQS